MKIAVIKEKIHLFINNACDDKIKAMYSMIENDLDKDADSRYSEEFKKELDSRILAYKSGVSIPVSTEESKKRVRKILASRQ